MTKFKRGIQNMAFIKALNELYNDKNSFWYNMINDKELFVAIREEYLNVYYKGQSICRLEYNNNVVKGRTHKKYLGIKEDGYFISENGIILNKQSKVKSLNEIDQLKKNIETHIGKEKENSYSEILNNNKGIFDVEITLVNNKITKPIKKLDYEISSIDYVALEYNENKLVFYEAKHFTNPEIRSRTTPRVFGQISRYEEALCLHEKEVLSSYNLVLQNLNDLHILTTRNTLNKKLITGKISIDFKPKLIVFGIDSDKKDDIHLKKLREHFGNRLILKYK
jgi:hypothetical protein